MTEWFSCISKTNCRHPREVFQHITNLEMSTGRKSLARMMSQPWAQVSDWYGLMLDLERQGEMNSPLKVSFPLSIYDYCCAHPPWPHPSHQGMVVCNKAMDLNGKTLMFQVTEFPEKMLRLLNTASASLMSLASPSFIAVTPHVQKRVPTKGSRSY